MIHKTSAIVTQVGGGTAFASGATYVLGLTPAEWSVIGVLGGLVIGFAGFAFNAWLGWRRDQRERGLR